MDLPRGIRKRGNVYQVNVTREGVRRSGTAKTLDEAAALHAKLVAELTSPAPATRGWTMRDAYKQATEGWRGTNSERNAVRNAWTAVEFFGKGRSVTEIDASAIDAYRVHLEGTGNSPATINRKMSALSKLLSLAVEHDKLVKKPRIRRLKEVASRIRWLTPEEETGFIRVLTQWDRQDFLDAFVVLLDTGMRGGELWRLNSHDVDFKQNILSIWVNKTNRPRSLVMTKRVREIMERRCAAGGVLFPAVNNWNFRTTFERVKSVLGLEADTALVPYCLRHTCCTRLIRSGVPFRVVMEWMGHASIQTTMRYAHLAPTDLAHCASILESGRNWQQNQMSAD